MSYIDLEDEQLIEADENEIDEENEVELETVENGECSFIPSLIVSARAREILKLMTF